MTGDEKLATAIQSGYKFDKLLLSIARVEFLFGMFVMGIALTIVSVFDFSTGTKVSIMIAAGVAYLGAVVADGCSSVSAQIFSSAEYMLEEITKLMEKQEVGIDPKLKS